MKPLFNGYACNEYLTPEYRVGFFDEIAQWWLIVPKDEAYERGDFLVIGSPGIDQIEWGYRKDESGIWMYEPVNDEFRYLASSLADLVNGWETGALSV